MGAIVILIINLLSVFQIDSASKDYKTKTVPDNHMVAENEYCPKHIAYPYEISELATDHPSAVMFVNIIKGHIQRVFCAGTLLTSTHVLTSARCVSGINMDDTRVYGGCTSWIHIVNRKDEDIQIRSIKGIFPHNSFDKNIDPDEDDLAVVEVTMPFLIIRPECSIMPLGKRPLQPGHTDCYITGFGMESGTTTEIDTNITYNLQLMKTRSITVTKRCICSFRRSQGDLVEVRAPFICHNAQSDNQRRFAFGDIGAGLICNGKLHGVLTSILNYTFQDSCARKSSMPVLPMLSETMRKAMKRHTLVFASTCAHIRWIAKSTGNNEVVTESEITGGECDREEKEFDKVRAKRKEAYSKYPYWLPRGLATAQSVNTALVTVTITALLLC